MGDKTGKTAGKTQVYLWNWIIRVYTHSFESGNWMSFWQVIKSSILHFQDWLPGQKTGTGFYWECLLPPAFSGNRTAFALLEKAKKELLQVTFTFSYVREYQLVQTEKLLEKLGHWCRKEKQKLE